MTIPYIYLICREKEHNKVWAYTKTITDVDGFSITISITIFFEHLV